MTEFDQSNGDCELLVRARSLALRKGLDPEKVNCPYSPDCDGRACVNSQSPRSLTLYLRTDNVGTPPSQKVKFYQKLDMWAKLSGVDQDPNQTT